MHMKCFNAKPDYIHFVKFSGQSAQAVVFMAFCIGTQTLNGILAAIYLDLTSEFCHVVQARENKAFLTENAHV